MLFLIIYKNSLNHLKDNIMINQKILITIIICFLTGCSSIPSYKLQDDKYSIEKEEILRQGDFLVSSMANASRKLHDISWRIMKANKDICTNSIINAFGIMIAGTNDLPLSLQSSFRAASPNIIDNINEYISFPMIVSVANNSPADNAKLMEGDFILSVNNIKIDNMNYKSLLRDAAIKRNLEIKVQRLEKEYIYNLKSEAVCGHPVQPMVSPIPNAYADGSKIYITIATLDFVEDDQELAFLIGHELVHNILHYRGKGIEEIEAKPIPIKEKPSLQDIRDLFIFQSASKETEADLLGIEFVLKAGISQDKVASYFRRLSIYMPQLMEDSIFRMHPGNAKRVTDIEKRLKILKSKYSDLNGD